MGAQFKSRMRLIYKKFITIVFIYESEYYCNTNDRYFKNNKNNKYVSKIIYLSYILLYNIIY